MANQRNLFKVFIDETNEDTVCEFFREFVERFNVRATDTYKDEYVILEIDLHCKWYVQKYTLYVV